MHRTIDTGYLRLRRPALRGPAVAASVAAARRGQGGVEARAVGVAELRVRVVQLVLVPPQVVVLALPRPVLDVGGVARADREVRVRVAAARTRQVGIAGEDVGTVVLDERRAAPDARLLAAQQAGQAVPVGAAWGRHAGPLVEGRAQVEVLGDAGGRHAGRD